MRIGLIAVDGRGGFPNLALMRLSTWHKRQGDAADWWNGFECYDRVYMSKVFTFTPDFDTAISADEIITGGTAMTVRYVRRVGREIIILGLRTG